MSYPETQTALSRFFFVISNLPFVVFTVAAPGYFSYIGLTYHSYAMKFHLSSALVAAAVYGHLYNWFAVNDTCGLCPDGWRIPTDDDWTVITGLSGTLAIMAYGGHPRRKIPDLHFTGACHMTIPPSSEIISLKNVAWPYGV